MNKALLLGGLVAASLALAGCQNARLRLPELPRAQDTLQLQRVEALLRFQSQALAMSPEQRKVMAAELRPQVERGCSDRRLQLVMVLESAGEPPAPDLGQTLEPCLAAETPQAVRELATGLIYRLQRQRNHAAADAAQRRELEQQLDAARRQQGELQKQLEGLKAIERSLQQRDG